MKHKLSRNLIIQLNGEKSTLLVDSAFDIISRTSSTLLRNDVHLFLFWEANFISLACLREAIRFPLLREIMAELRALEIISVSKNHTNSIFLSIAEFNRTSLYIKTFNQYKRVNLN